jgi:UDP-glucose:(heptosyl)LPS alpha-1,3-glucosyltransferase
MKIAVVIPKFGLLGGAENFSYELCKRLAEREGFEIHVFANQWRKGNSPITFHKIPIIPFPRFVRPLSFAQFSYRRIHRQKYDLIHSHDRIFRMDLFTVHGIPHKTWIKEARQKPMSLFDRSLAWVEKKGIMNSAMPMILPVSTLVKEELLRLYPIPESKIRVIYPGVSTDRFSVLNQEGCRHEIRQRHGLTPSDVIVLFVGMNFEIKGLELVIKGTADLIAKRNRNSSLKLLVVGKGKKERYMSLAQDLGIANRVVFAGVTREVEKYYLASDIFVLPSHFDASPLAVLEAMTAGLPVIITQRVGAKDLIHSGAQGFVLAEKPSPSDFGEKLAFLMERDNRLKLGKNAQKVALRHTWQRTADEVASLYHQLLDAKMSNP